MTNIIILLLTLNTNQTEVTLDYYVPCAPSGSLAFFDAKRHVGDPWLKDYGVATVHPGTNTVTFRAPFQDQAFLRVRIEPPPSLQEIPLQGVYSAEMGGHYQTGPVLTEGQSYRLVNRSGDTLTVMVLDGSRDQYFPVMAGGIHEFKATGTRLDLFTGDVGGAVQGIELRRRGDCD